MSDDKKFNYLSYYLRKTFNAKGILIFTGRKWIVAGKPYASKVAHNDNEAAL